MSERLPTLYLLEYLLHEGFRIHASRRRDLVQVYPKAQLTDRLRCALQEHKAKIVDILDPPAPGGTCNDCGSINFVRRPTGPWRCMECWELGTGEAVEWFYGPLAWHREEKPA